MAGQAQLRCVPLGIYLDLPWWPTDVARTLSVRNVSELERADKRPLSVPTSLTPDDYSHRLRVAPQRTATGDASYDLGIRSKTPVQDLDQTDLPRIESVSVTVLGSATTANRPVADVSLTSNGRLTRRLDQADQAGAAGKNMAKRKLWRPRSEARAPRRASPAGRRRETRLRSVAGRHHRRDRRRHVRLPDGRRAGVHVRRGGPGPETVTARAAARRHHTHPMRVTCGRSPPSNGLQGRRHLADVHPPARGCPDGCATTGPKSPRKATPRGVDHRAGQEGPAAGRSMEPGAGRMRIVQKRNQNVLDVIASPFASDTGASGGSRWTGSSTSGHPGVGAFAEGGTGGSRGTCAGRQPPASLTPATR